MLFVLTSLLFFLGALTASLVCLLAGRHAAADRLNTAHSRCACGRELHLYEVVPLLGFALARGRARCCGAAIPLRFMLFELLGGLGLATLPWLGLPLGAVLAVASWLAVAYLEQRAVAHSLTAVSNTAARDEGERHDPRAGARP